LDKGGGEGRMLRDIVVDGYVVDKFVSMWDMIPSIEFGEAATADRASWCIAMGSKTYHLDLIESSQLHTETNRRSIAALLTHLMRRGST